VAGAVFPVLGREEGRRERFDGGEVRRIGRNHAVDVDVVRCQEIRDVVGDRSPRAVVLDGVEDVLPAGHVEFVEREVVTGPVGPRRRSKVASLVQYRERDGVVCRVHRRPVRVDTEERPDVTPGGVRREVAVRIYPSTRSTRQLTAGAGECFDAAECIFRVRTMRRVWMTQQGFRSVPRRRISRRHSSLTTARPRRSGSPTCWSTRQSFSCFYTVDFSPDCIDEWCLVPGLRLVLRDGLGSRRRHQQVRNVSPREVHRLSRRRFSAVLGRRPRRRRTVRRETPVVQAVPAGPAVLLPRRPGRNHPVPVAGGALAGPDTGRPTDRRRSRRYRPGNRRVTAPGHATFHRSTPALDGARATARIYGWDGSCSRNGNTVERRRREVPRRRRGRTDRHRHRSRHTAANVAYVDPDPGIGEAWLQGFRYGDADEDDIRVPF